MNRGTFYKASKRVLARKDLTAAEKLIRIVRAHWRAFEGEEPTTVELAKATGLGKRTIRRLRAAKMSGSERPKCPAKMTAQAAKMAGPSCSKSYGLGEIETKGERQTTPLPLLNAREKKGDGTVAVLAAKAKMGGGKWRFEQWAGQVQEDTAAGRYRRADLEAFVAGRTAITEAPWRLAESVRRHAEAAKAAAFRERLRRIRVEGLSDARREGDERRWRVRYADERDGLLILETIVQVDRVTLERLETMLAGQKRLVDPAGRGPVAQSLRRRIEAIRAGCPDPDPPEVPKPERREIRSLADLAGWQFRPYQPTLF